MTCLASKQVIFLYKQSAFDPMGKALIMLSFYTNYAFISALY